MERNICCTRVFPLESILETIFLCGNKTWISIEIPDSKDKTFQFWSSVCKSKKMDLSHAEKSLINIFFNEVNLQRNSSNAL